MKKIVIYSCISFFIISCGNSIDNKIKPETSQMRDSILESIKAQENNLKKIIHSSASSLDVNAATAIYNSYTFFATHFPDDSLAPMFLFKASDVASSALNRNEDAITILDKIILKYPNFKRMPECYFLRGFFCQKNITDSSRAKKYFDLMIEKYPNHELAEQAKQMKLLVGKSDEEIIKQFEKQSK